MKYRVLILRIVGNTIKGKPSATVGRKDTDPLLRVADLPYIPEKAHLNESGFFI
jgi:hypothetical protein